MPRSPRRAARTRTGRRSARTAVIAPGAPRRRDRAAVPRLAAVECVDNGSLLEAMRERVLPRAANNIRFFADYARRAARRAAAHAARRRAQQRPPRPLRRGRRLDAVERAVDARDLARRAGARGRQHRRPQAARVGAADLLDARRPREPAGLPPGVLNIVHGSGAGAGAPLTGHPGVDRVAFTGSPATARTVYRDAAAQLTPVSFELGGKSPFVVFADCDLDAAAATAAYQYDNPGQVCLAGTRLLVERGGARAVPRAPSRARRRDRRRRSAACRRRPTAR